MEDNIFKQANNTNVNEYTNPNLTGDYQNVETVVTQLVKQEQELAKDIVNNAKDIKAPEKQHVDMNLLLKSDNKEKPVVQPQINPNIHKFINNEKPLVEYKEQVKQFNGFDNLYTDFVPSDNKIVNEYKVPDLKLGEEDDIEKINI